MRIVQASAILNSSCAIIISNCLSNDFDDFNKSVWYIRISIDTFLSKKFPLDR